MAEPTARPTNKMIGVGISGAITTVLITISRDAFAYEMTPDLAAAITAIVTFVTGYFTTNETAQEPPDA